MIDEKARSSVDHVDFRGRQRSEFWTVNDEPSKTVQSDAPEADLNVIMAKAGRASLVEHLAEVDGAFLDVSEFDDYAAMARHVAAAKQEFMKLHSKVRELFDHDVHKWLDAAHEEDKIAAMRELGYNPDGSPYVAPAPPEAVAAPVEPPVEPSGEPPA